MGFSWTIVPLVRADIKWFIIQLLVFLLSCGLAAFTFGATLIALLVFPFIYNRIYARDLLEVGYKPESKEDADILVNKGVLAG